MTTVLLVALTLTVPSQPSERIDFIGFSRDGLLAAYRHEVHQPRPDGSVDQYTLVHTIDTQTGFNIAAFRASAILRVDSDRRSLSVDHLQLKRDNPRFAKAYSKKRWRQLERRKGFTVVPIKMDTSTIQMTQDGKVPSGIEAAQEHMRIFGAPNQALSFVVILNRKGTSAEIGRFQHKGVQGRALTSRVQAYTSSSRRSIAVVATFVTDDGTKREVSQIKVMPLKGKPLRRKMLAHRRSSVRYASAASQPRALLP